MDLLEVQKRQVKEGEWVELTAYDWHTEEPMVELKYPSGFVESVTYEALMRGLNLPVGSNEERHFISYLSSWRKIATCPSKQLIKIRVRDPKDTSKEIYV